MIDDRTGDSDLLGRFFAITVDLPCITTLAGRFVRVSHQWTRTLGWTVEELVGRPFVDLVHPDDVAATVAATAHLADGREVVGFENRYRTKDGRWRWLSWNSVADVPHELIIASARDVTEARTSESELREAHERFSKVFDLSPVAMALADAEDGRIVDANEAFLGTLGLRREEVVGFTTVELGLMTPEARAQLLATLAAHGRMISSEWSFPLPGGRTAVGLLSAVLLPLAGKPHILSAVVDISERKRASEENARLQGELLQAQKMEAIGRLAGGVAHDFNNILTSIQGYADLTLDALVPADPLREDVLEIRKAADRAAALTQQLLAFSRKQVIDPRPIDLNAVLADSRRMLARLIGEDVELAFRPGEGLGLVRADPHQIDQVLVNLAVNARDAMPDGGRLALETSVVEADAAFVSAHPGIALGEYVVLTVSDTGCGMDEATRAHIFEPFFTTKEKGRGTGLGLATVYGVVHQGGGHITVRSEPGVGTTFRVYLPRLAGTVAAPVPVRRSATPGRGEFVLLVEDEPVVRRLAQRILGRNGYSVVAASSPSEALAVATGPGARIDLLLTDVVMPGGNGRDLYERLAVLRPGLKVLFMSGYAEDVVAHHGVLEGGGSFVPKPFTAEELLRRVREALER